MLNIKFDELLSLIKDENVVSALKILSDEIGKLKKKCGMGLETLL